MAMQLKELFQKLRNSRTYPSISILLPTHRIAPENAQDRVLLKNLIQEAKDRLLATYPERAVKGIFKYLDHAEREYDPMQNEESLAVFVNADFCEVVQLSVPVEAQVVIEDNFATRVIIQAMTNTHSYYILTLSEKNTHLLEAHVDRAHEVHAGGFPLPNKHHHVSSKQRANWNKEEDKVARDYFAEVDAHVEEALKRNPLPLVVAGTEHTLDNFRQVTRHAANILATVLGNFDHSAPAELGKIAWEQVKVALQQQQRSSLDLLGKARNGKKAVLGVAEVFTLAKQGRGEVLFAEADYFQPAALQGDQILLGAQNSSEGYVTDVVDEIAETVLNNSGRVQFLDKGMLEAYGSPIALVLRY